MLLYHLTSCICGYTHIHVLTQLVVSFKRYTILEYISLCIYISVCTYDYKTTIYLSRHSFVAQQKKAFSVTEKYVQMYIVNLS
jgi:hypothetical protein